MGPYCKFCGQRCFVLNRMTHPERGADILATCVPGQQFDKEQLGYCWDDVKRMPNPVTREVDAKS